MNTETIQPGDSGRKKYFLSSGIILRYLIGNDDKIETMIICKDSDTDLITTNLALHEAFGSINQNDELKPGKTAKLFENVDVLSYRQMKGQNKPVLTHERMDELRELALKK